MAPGPTPGALRFVSPAPHVLSRKGERPRRHVSARKVSEPVHYSGSGTGSSTANLPRTQAHATHSAQQAWMNSRNLLTIASGPKHRQHVFLHPTDGIGTQLRARLGGARCAFRIATQRAFATESVAQDLRAGGSHQGDPSQEALRISPAGSDAREAARLADSSASFYTTSFPFMSSSSPHSVGGAGLDQKWKPRISTRGAWPGCAQKRQGG